MCTGCGAGDPSYMTDFPDKAKWASYYCEAAGWETPGAGQTLRFLKLVPKGGQSMAPHTCWNGFRFRTSNGDIISPISARHVDGHWNNGSAVAFAATMIDKGAYPRFCQTDTCEGRLSCANFLEYCDGSASPESRALQFSFADSIGFGGVEVLYTYDAGLTEEENCKRVPLSFELHTSDNARDWALLMSITQTCSDVKFCGWNRYGAAAMVKS